MSEGEASARYALMRERECRSESSRRERTHSSQPQRTSCGTGSAAPRSSSSLMISYESRCAARISGEMSAVNVAVSGGNASQLYATPSFGKHPLYLSLISILYHTRSLVEFICITNSFRVIDEIISHN